MDIIELLHYQQPEYKQKLGIRLALNESDLRPLLYYAERPEYGENISKIFVSLDYYNCFKYFDDLFSWIEDLNTPGALRIFEYLIQAPAEILYQSFEVALLSALKNNTPAKNNMILLLNQNTDLFNLLKKRNFELFLLIT